MIDTLLTVFLVSIIMIIIKWGGAFLSYGWKRGREKMLETKYPLKTDVFPIKALAFGDEMEIKDLGTCKFQGKDKDKYYIESTEGDFSNKLSYMYVDKDFLMSNCIRLFTKHVTKWESVTK